MLDMGAVETLIVWENLDVAQGLLSDVGKGIFIICVSGSEVLIYDFFASSVRNS